MAVNSVRHGLLCNNTETLKLDFTGIILAHRHGGPF